MTCDFETSEQQNAKRSLQAVVRRVFVFAKLKASRLEYVWTRLGWGRDGALWGKVTPLAVTPAEAQEIVARTVWQDGWRMEDAPND